MNGRMGLFPELFFQPIELLTPFGRSQWGFAHMAPVQELGPKLRPDTQYSLADLPYSASNPIGYAAQG